MSINPANRLKRAAEIYYWLDCPNEAAYDSCNSTVTNGGVNCGYDGNFMTHGVVPYTCARECHCAPVSCSSYCGESDNVDDEVEAHSDIVEI
jgi:hypothetical protein